MEKDKYTIVLSALIIIGVYYLTIKCPIKFLFGISCPGCGMTRAWISLLRLDVKKAFYYHPLWVVPAVYILLYAIKLKSNKKANNSVLFVIIILFLCTYLCRLISGDMIVKIDLRAGLIYKIISKII